MKRLQKDVKIDLAGNDRGSIGSHPKLPKKASVTYPLKLTLKQRETLLEHTHLSGELMKKIEQAGEGTQVVSVTWVEVKRLRDKIGLAAACTRSLHRKRLLSVMDRLVKFFEEENAEDFDLRDSTPAKRRSSKLDLLFQIKITLLGAEPPIWRRIQVKDCTLDELHRDIQKAMGWTDSHLHQFEINGKSYRDRESLHNGFGDSSSVDSTETLLSDIVPKTGRRFAFKYEYDFGDCWEHEILFEGNPSADPKASYPLCLEGQRACPPEDCGGVVGFSEFLRAIRNPKHQEHEVMMELFGGRFDPKKFDAKEATKAMKRGRTYWTSER